MEKRTDDEIYRDFLEALTRAPFPRYDANKAYWSRKARELNEVGLFRRAKGSPRVRRLPHNSRTLALAAVRLLAPNYRTTGVFTAPSGYLRDLLEPADLRFYSGENGEARS